MASDQMITSVEAAIAKALQSTLAPLAATLEQMNVRLQAVEQRNTQATKDNGTAVVPPESTNNTMTRSLSRKSMRTRLGSRRSMSTNKTKSLGEDKEGGSDQLDPVMAGDLIFLKHVVDSQVLGDGAVARGLDDRGEGVTGFLSGDIAYQRCGVQLAPSSRTTNAEELLLDFTDSAVFRLVPMLPYRQRNELEALEASKASSDSKTNNRTTRASSVAGDGGSAEALLRQRVRAEEAGNAATMQSLEVGGGKGRPLKYGVVCQLQHVASGLFLRAHADAAPIDPECRLLTLGAGSSATYLRVMPKFKAQTEGSIVYHTHSVVFEAVSQRGMFLHASSGSFYDATPSPRDLALPKNLRTGRILECNVSPASSTFVLRKFARVEKKTASCLQSGQPFRLFHSQSDAFVQASCDAMKGEWNSREEGQPLHAPYLRTLGGDGSGGGDGSDGDPTNPSNQSVKGLWCLEFPRRSVGGPSSWGGLMRVRHVASGLYLSVDHGSEDASGGESWFTCRLVDDAWRNGGGGEESDEEDDDYDAAADHEQRTDPQAMLFKVFSADKTEAEFIPGGESSIQLEHHFSDPVTGEKRTLYLHNSEKRKPPRLVKPVSGGGGPAALAAAAAAAAAAGAVVAAEGGGGGGGVLLGHSFRLVFSSVKSAQDIFKLMNTQPAELWTCRLVKALLKAVNVYAQVLVNPDLTPPSRDYLKPFVALLLRAVGLCMKGDMAFPSDVDWVKKANSLAPAAFSALFAGDPNPPTQRVCRDMKLLDAVFKTGLAPYQRTFPVNPWGAKEASGLSSAFGVQKLAHVLLQTLCAGCPASQAYFGRRSSIVKSLSMVTTTTTTTGGAGGKGGGGAAGVFLPPPPPGGVLVKQLWMDTLLEQLEDALGPAVTLAKLLSSSEELLKRYATPKLVLRFADMVKLLGPQRRLVDFFSAICLVQGKAVKANQEMVLRLTWMKPDVRRTVYLELRPLAGGPRGDDLTQPPPPCAEALLKRSSPVEESSGGALANRMMLKKTKKGGGGGGYGEVALPSGVGFTDGRLDPKAKTPPNFLGRDLYQSDGGFPTKVGVTWSGLANWGRGKLDHLFWDADNLGIDNSAKQPRPGEEAGEEEVVRLEELCWVLDPGHLCEAVTGQPWESADASMEADPGGDAKTHFDRKVALASYFVGQLKLHTAMCSGRSYNAIRWLEGTFASYETLSSLGYNPHLPRLVRAAAVDLVNALYLDRFPQLHSCGKPSLPEQLWVYEMQGSHEESAAAAAAAAAGRGRTGTVAAGVFGSGVSNLFAKSREPVKAPDDGTPLVRPLLLEEDGSLPCFAISKSHTCYSDPDPFNSFPSHFKFFILRNLGNAYFKGFGDGCLVHSQKDENALASSVCSLVASLLSFGFQSHKAKLEELVPILVRVLDGRTDVETVSTTLPRQRVPFQPPERRFVLTSVSPSVTGLKVLVLKCLKNITQIRTNFRLANALATFQEMNSDPKQRHELKRLARCLSRGGPYEGPLVGKLFEAFEDNFVKAGGAALMLEALGKANVDTILLDCLLYEDDTLFSAALEVLEGTFTQRRQLLGALRDVILLQKPALPVFGDVAALSSELGFLTFLTRSYSVWGVCSRVSGPFGPDKYEQALLTLDRLAEFFAEEAFTVKPPDAEDDDEHQDEAGGEGSLMAKLNKRRRSSGGMLGIELPGTASRRASGAAASAAAAAAQKGRDELEKNISFEVMTNPMKENELETMAAGGDDNGGGGGEAEKKSDGGGGGGGGKRGSVVKKRRQSAFDVSLSEQPAGVTKAHQDVARSVNLQTTLFEGLAVDYNLAFRGSICTSEEKAQSRRYLVEVQRRLVSVLETFVTHNPTNQALVWGKASQALGALLGPLKLPPWPEDFPEPLKADVPTHPGLGVEGVVVECLRGHEHLCAEAVSRGLFEEFGKQLNGFPDPSTAETQFEFFEIVARPRSKPIPRNQSMVVEVFLSEKLPTLRACVEAVFGAGQQQQQQRASSSSAVVLRAASGSGGENGDEDEEDGRQGLGWSPACSEPARMCRLLAACVAGGNVSVASLLQRQRFNMDVGLEVLLKLLESKEASALKRFAKAKKQGGGVGGGADTEQEQVAAAAAATEAATAALVEDAYCGEMLVLVSELMECLVVDPRLFRRRGTWRILATVCKGHLRRFAQELKAHGSKSKLLRTAGWASYAAACAKFSALVIGGSRAIGFTDFEQEFEAAVRGPGGLVPSCVALFTSGGNGPEFSKLRAGCEALADAVDPNLLEGNRRSNRVNSVAVLMEGLKTNPAPSAARSVRGTGVGGVVRSLWRGKGGGGSHNDDGEDSTAAAAAAEAAEANLAAEAKAEAKAIRAYEDPSAMLKHFVKALQENPKIKNKLQARRFQFALVLETVESSLTPQGGGDQLDGGGDGDSAGTAGGMVGEVGVSWSTLVERMVSFATTHNFDADETHVVRVFNALRFHLMRARSSSDGKEQDSGDLSSEDVQLYRAKQSLLDSKGCVQCVCRAMATHSFGNALADSALLLLSECLNTGNADAQASVLGFVKLDSDAKLVRHFRCRLDDALAAVRERKERTSSGFEPLPPHMESRFQNAVTTLRMLQLLCEGHNAQLQDLVREQPWHAFSLNLASDVTGLFVAQAETLAMLRRLEDGEVELLAMTLDCLVELVQGPSPGNQELFSCDDAFLNALDKVLQSDFHPRVSKLLRLGVKSKAVCLLAALLEGRHDRDTHHRLMAIFEPAAFEIFQSFLAKTYADATALGDSLQQLQQLGGAAAGAAATALVKGAVAVAGAANVADLAAAQEAAAEKAVAEAEETEELLEEVASASVCLERVRRELADASPSFAHRLKDLELLRSFERNLTTSGVAQVEVAWQGRVEAVTFSLPPEHKYLSGDTKEKFLHSGDVSTVDKRGKRLLHQTPIFIDEMVQVYALAETSEFYGFLHRNLVNIKWSMYALVVLLNLNIVMASYGSHSKKGYPSAARGNPHTDAYDVSLVITWVLGMLNAVGYVIIVTFLGITEIPIVIRQVDHFVASHAHTPTSKHYNLGAFTWWGVTLVFNVMFIVMHVANYPGEPNETLYLFLVLGINLPWTLSCVRNYIVVPSTPQTRLFVVIYDVLVTKPFFRNHVALMAASMAGFQSSPFFTLMLMDIVNNSRILGNIIKSITMPADKLGIVFYTIVCTVVIYAQFGLEYFEDYFSFGTDDDQHSGGCHSVVACFWLILYKGVPANSLGDLMNPLNSKSNDFFPRIIFELSFFVWVGILLFDILTGLIVDAFGTLRNEENERTHTLTNECFVCGFARSNYDEAAGKLVQGPSFDDHSAVEHDLWNYVYFYRYLETKDPTEYNGVESYVAALIEQEDLAWLPQRTSLALQSAGLTSTAPARDSGGGEAADGGGGGGGGVNDDDDEGGGGGGVGAAVSRSVRAEVGIMSKSLLSAVDKRIEELERVAASAAAAAADDA